MITVSYIDVVGKQFVMPDLILNPETLFTSEILYFG